ncbi:hypothetical protein BBBOND_0303230 [Babesia bigemina]|uniref:Uncharacterized protein n=1 Tax=Babesia bigemina TaxID=5866 RepID=A0A061DBZ5_BABBI|nr:hypothetical protein BBBOND_0303230 [Babesia bigemina]CDR96419.1 hypothetical protein BBBOND_0303230 [Babesia bigemina]|eukprot:XP_012768605.1 hypothetical protein BBBOND_0303230 [Babesia bigemina]
MMLPALVSSSLSVARRAVPRFGTRGFSGRRARRTVNSQMTPQQQLLYQQKLKEMQLAQMQPPRKQGFLDIIKEGAMHGIGWAFGQRLVDSILGPRTMNIGGFNNSSNSNDQVGGGNEGDNMPSGSSGYMNDSNDGSYFDEEGGDNSGWSWGSDWFNDEE